MPDAKPVIPVSAVGWRDVVPVLRPGELCLCRCEPGAGKASLALGLVRDLVARSAAPVHTIYVSTDLSEQVVTQKVVAAMTGLTYATLERCDLLADQQRAVDLAREAMMAWPLDILVMPGASIDDIVAAVHHRDRATSGGIGALIVDYLNLETLAAAWEVPDETMGAALLALKALAVDLGVPVIAMAPPSDDELDEPDDVDAVLDLCLLEDSAEGSLREVSLLLLRSSEGSTGGTRMVFDAGKMVHREWRAAAEN